MIQSAFFDFDYTLYSHEAHCIPESAKKAIKLLQKNGVKCFLATGRSNWELLDFPCAYEIGLDGYSMCEGQLIQDRNRNTVYESFIEGEDKLHLIQLYEEKVIPTIFMTDRGMYLNFANEEILNSLSRIGTTCPQIKPYDGENIYYAAPYLQRDKDSYLRERLPNCRLVRWGDNGVDVTPADSTKYTGILKCMEIFHLNNECMAFGDEENDYEMVEAATIGVAMGNACRKLKDIADYTTTDIDDDGILNAVMHYGFN